MYTDITHDNVDSLQALTAVYQTLNKSRRSLMAYQAFWGILKNFYLNRYPYIIGGKFLRAVGIKTPNEKKIEDLQKIVEQI